MACALFKKNQRSEYKKGKALSGFAFSVFY
jgi:hypothetical protein